MFFTVIIAVVIIVLISKGMANHSAKKKKNGHKSNIPEYLQIAYSKGDFTMQALMLLGYAYFSMSLLAINDDINNLIDLDIMILIIGLIGIVFGYWKKVFFVAMTGVPLTVGWVIYKIFDVMDGNDIKVSAYLGIIGLLSIVTYLVTYYHSEKFKRFSLVFGTAGMAVLTGILLTLSTREGLNIFEDAGEGFWVTWPVSVIVILLLGVIAGQLVRFMGNKKLSIQEGLALIVYALIFVFLLFVPQLEPFLPGTGRRIGELSATGLALALFFNVIIFGHFAGIVIVGYLRKSKTLINLGVFLIFIVIIFKYFSWFWTLLDRSVFFIVVGILFVGLGWFMERSRRKLMANIKGNVTTS